ncbi:hypothetical protein [Xenococcus sp. PCC 7305]|uniref:hypothetical protein n=1 Tax=Xenococcus sp. PCC 7305 TaxID=102125 RepID=UPI0002DCF496|nr:hypothetical protein [Xenococcus sp. PCC 7305]
MLILIGCSNKSKKESNIQSYLTLERNEYIPVEIENISEDIPLTGKNPSKIALAIFGFKDNVEGNFQEELTVNTNNPNQLIVTLAQMGFPDDSVRNIRYRIEFIPKDNQWHLVWAGWQQMCWPGRGSQDWTTEQCF